jgi:hypothetical protein
MHLIRVIAIVVIACVLGSLRGCFALSKNVHLDNGVVKDTAYFDDRCTGIYLLLRFILLPFPFIRTSDKSFQKLKRDAHKIIFVSVCEFIVGFILGELGRDRNPDRIRIILETTCNNVPSLLQKTCHDFIAEYAEPLIVAIQQGKTIEKICQELSLCSSQQFTKRVCLFCECYLSLF